MWKLLAILVMVVAARGQEPAAVAPVVTPAITPLGHVEQRGTGPVPMVLVPQLLCDWSLFDSFMERNASRYTMFAVTLPGFGGSEPPPMPKETEPSAAGPWLVNAEKAIIELIAAKKLDRPVLVGQSMGGLIAMRIGAAHPDLCRGVVAINAWPGFPVAGASLLMPQARAQIVDGGENVPEKSSIRSWIATMEEPKWREQQRDWLMRSISSKERGERLAAIGDKVPKAVSGRYMLEYFGADASEALRKNTTPLLVLAPLDGFGKNEESKVWRELWKRVYDKVPKTTLVYFDRTKEFVADESPEQFDRVVEAFVKGEPVGEAPPPAPDVPTGNVKQEPK